MMVRGLRNWTVRVGKLHRRLRQEIGTATDVRRMEEAVVFEREIRVDIFAGEPFADGLAVHDGFIVAVLWRGESVHGVFLRLFIPRGGVRVVGEHVRGERKADEVPTVLLGLGVVETAAGRFAGKKTVGLRADDALEIFLESGVELVPKHPRAETE